MTFERKDKDQLNTKIKCLLILQISSTGIDGFAGNIRLGSTSIKILRPICIQKSRYIYYHHDKLKVENMKDGNWFHKMRLSKVGRISHTDIRLGLV